MHLFKEGILPMWEDPANAKGAKCSMLIKSRSPVAHFTASFDVDDCSVQRMRSTCVGSVVFSVSSARRLIWTTMSAAWLFEFMCTW